MVHVGRFFTSTPHDAQAYSHLDIREGTRLRADRRLLSAQSLPRPLVKPRLIQTRPLHPTQRGRKKIKAPFGGIVSRWPPR